MHWQDIRTRYLRPLRSALRERGIVVYSIVIPVVLYPLLIWIVYTAFSYASGQAAELQSHIVLRNLPVTHLELRRAIQADRTIDIEFSEDPDRDIKNGPLDLIVDFVRLEDAPALAEGSIGGQV